MAIFRMKFGPFNGSTLEQIIFKPKGVEYLEWIKEKMEKGEWKAGIPRYNHVKKTLERAEKLPLLIQKKCSICHTNIAEWCSVRGRQNDGFLISEWFIFCDFCYRREKKTADRQTYFLKMIPQSEKFFKRVKDKEIFLKLLKKMYDFPERIRAEELQFVFKTMDNYHSVAQGRLFDNFILSATDLVFIFKKTKQKKK